MNVQLDLTHHATSDTLVDQARTKTGGQLTVNQVVTVATNGRLNHRFATYICAPRENDKSLKKCYKAIFSEVIKQNAKSVDIPALSVQSGGFEPKTAARIAVKQASKCVQVNKDIQIRFVTYCSKDNKERDNVNAKAYQKALKGLKQQTHIQKSQIQSKEGEIQECSGDLIVIPVGLHYSTLGAVAKAVETTYQQRTKIL